MFILESFNWSELCFFSFSNLVPKEDYEKWKGLAKVGMDSKPVKVKHIVHCLKESFANRKVEKEEMVKQKYPMITSILDDWPAFQYGTYVNIIYYT